MKKIVITGVTSFIGFHLAKQLSHFYDVIATTSGPLDSYTGIQKTRLELLKNQNIIFDSLDVTQKDQIVSVIEKHRPDYWINHAGYTKNYASHDYDEVLADSIHSAPLETIFDELAKVDCQAFIGTGTCMEYSDLDIPHKEDENCSPSTPYGRSKLKQTMKSLELGKKYNIPTSIVRVFIPFGDYDDPKKLFPALVQNLWKNKEMPLSTGEQVRNFIPIDELINLYFLLLKEEKKHGIYNGGSTLNISVKNFILKITEEQRLDQGLLKFGVYPLRAGESLYCTVDFGKLKNFYSERTNNKFYFIESAEDLEEAKNQTGLMICSSPVLKKKLQSCGHFVFDTLPFFSAADHFSLSKKVNSEMAKCEKKLLEQFNSEFSFNTIFYMQFIKGRNEFNKLLKEKFVSHFPFLKDGMSNRSNMSLPTAGNFLFSKLNFVFLLLCPQIKKTIFLTAHHNLMVKHVTDNHPQEKLGLIVCSDRKKSGIKKTFFNFVNLLPSFIKKPFFESFFKYPYNFVIDSSLLFNSKEQNDLMSGLNIDLDTHLKERVSAHFLASRELGKIFKLYKPHSFFHLANVDIARYWGRFANENAIPSFLISHGSHAVNECQEIEEDIIRHAKGLTLSDHSTIISQSPMAETFLKKYHGSSFKKSTPILWGKKINKTISLREKFGISKDKKIILHASTPKTMNSRRFVIYETPDEYLNNIKKVAESTLVMKDIALLVKFRPNADIDLDVMKSALAAYPHVLIDQETPFLQCLHEADLVISYSSTTMEEALHYRVPVIQFSHIKGFSFLPTSELPNSPLITANEFTIAEKIEDIFHSKKDFSHFIYNF